MRKCNAMNVKWLLHSFSGSTLFALSYLVKLFNDSLDLVKPLFFCFSYRRLKVLFNKGVLKTFAKFTDKAPSLGYIFNKVVGFQQLYLRTTFYRTPIDFLIHGKITVLPLLQMFLDFAKLAGDIKHSRKF